MKTAMHYILDKLTLPEVAEIESRTMNKVLEAMNDFAIGVAIETLHNASRKIKHDDYILFDRWNETTKQVLNIENIPKI